MALLFAVLPLIGAGLVGWVEVGEHEFVDRRLIGESATVRFEDVNEVGIGMHQVRKRKLWYPEITRVDGSSVKFQALKSLSGQGTLDRVEEMYLACKAKLPDVVEQEPIEAVSIGADGELEFAHAPNYESFMREREHEQAAAAAMPAQPEPMPLAQPEAVEPKPRLLVAVESPPDIGEFDEDFEVFEPQPLTAEPQEPYLTVVPDMPAAEIASEQAVAAQAKVAVPTPPPIPQAPPTMIEQPLPGARAAKPTNEQNRQFTSLFRRAA